MTASPDSPALVFFTVTGVDRFPLEMLGHGSCWPASPADARALGDRLCEPRVGPLAIDLASHQEPDAEEWLRYGWTVAERGH